MADAARPGISRRDFVRNAVASATVGAAAASGFLAWQDSKDGGGTEYLGMKVVAGPAKRGLPLLPVHVRPDGVLVGAPDQMIAMAYCSRQEAPGLKGSYQGSEALVYHANTDLLRVLDERGTSVWWRDLVGQEARAADFPGVGSGAPVRWRSQGQLESNTLPLVLIKADPSWYPEAVRLRFASDGFVAASALCTHFCCTTGYQVSEEARAKGYWDHVYCVCHGATYDPRHVEPYRAPPER